MIDKYNNYNILPLPRLPFQGRSSFQITYVVGFC